MNGLMQEHGLLISSVIRHAAANHGEREVVSREPSGRLHRTNYREVERRARQLASGLKQLGVRPGDRVATLAMNHFRHLECFYAVSGMGAVLHTVNPRLFPDQIAFIINHAESRILLLDAAFVPLIERLAADLPRVEKLIVLAEPQLITDCAAFDVLRYEDLVASSPPGFEWPVFDEHAASSLCYTSGTTGGPKGVLYSHRSTLLHALATLQADSFGLRSVDVVLPVVPMFHVQAWSTPYGCAMAGAKLVLPGSQLDPASLVELIQSESVTFALGVPTVWSSLVGHLRETHQSIPTLERVLIGGSAMPPAIHRELTETYGVRAVHAWGMTEVSPIGTIATTTGALEAAPQAERAEALLKQGRPSWGVELKVTGADGETLPRDGKSSGLLWVRGPWVARRYFRREEELLDAEGWFPTGDVATLDGNGFLRITDRDKDVIKSGGEWISSIDIENIAMLHSGVRFAAAVGAHHPKWGERPVLVVVAVEGRAPTAEELLDFLRPRMAKWWLPDAVVFVRELPLTATGKVLKSKLRADYQHYLSQPGERPQKS